MNSPLQDYQMNRFSRFLERLSALQCIKGLVISTLFFKAFQVSSILTVLIITYNEETPQPLKLFLAIYATTMFVQGLFFIIRNREYFSVEQLPDLNEHSEIAIVNNFVDAFSLFWCLTGFHWTQECKTCRVTNPLLYYSTLIWSYYGMFVIISPLLAIVLLVIVVTYMRPQLPSFEYTPECNISGQDAICSICLTSYNSNEMIKMLPCDHHFHQQCIDEWFTIDDICPLCKKPVNVLYDLVEQPIV